ncbi:MFS transporter [Streptomyces sp. NPDC006372]|uniref:MFS transporter n=1 Tax=Streptomyces sp. NPDC006372 TaxID=3155599 RepID=UPI0033B30C31
MTDATVQQSDTSTQQAPRGALAVVLVAAFLVLADTSVVNIAAPVLQADLDASFAETQWVVASYQLAYAALLITGGRLGDLYGHRRLFVAGLLGFVLASTACAFATGPAVLIVARTLQGVTAAMMYPQTLSVIQVVVPPEQRPKAFATFGMVASSATIIGPMIAGVAIQANPLDSSWRLAFLVNVPVGVLGAIAAMRVLPATRSPHARRLDLPGVLTVTAALTCLCLPLIEGHEKGWPWWCFALLGCSVPLFALFALRCSAVHRRTKSALVPPSLWGQRGFTVGLVMYLLAYSGIASFFFYQSLMLQQAFDYSALAVSAIATPFAVGSLGGYYSSAALARHTSGRMAIVTGGLIWSIGVGAAGATALLAGDGLQGWYFLPSFLIAGLGLGLALAPLMGEVLKSVSGADAGSASGTLSTGQQIGAVLGMALIGSAYFAVLGSGDRQHYRLAFAVASFCIAVAAAALAAGVRFLPRTDTPR